MCGLILILLSLRVGLRTSNPLLLSLEFGMSIGKEERYRDIHNIN